MRRRASSAANAYSSPAPVALHLLHRLSMDGEQLAATRGLRFAALAAGVGGVLLFLWSIRTAGASAVRDGVSRVGWWFAVICLLGGIRYLLRALAWRMCLDDPRQLPLSVAFGAAVMGDALGNVTPFGGL